MDEHRGVVVSLRPWRLEDAAGLRAADRSTPDLRTQFGDVDLSDDDHARRFIGDVLVPDHQRRNWVIEDAGVLVGSIGLSLIEYRHRTAWVSYWLRSDSRGQGHAARAVNAAADWAFTHGLFRLELGHRTNNPASCRVATRAGFPVEGLERQKLQHGSQRFDVELHARLRTDPTPDALDPLEFQDV